MPVSSAGSPQLEPSWERLTYPQTFASSGTHRVFFNEPVWLNKGDVLGVQIFEGAIAKVASSQTPDCVLPSGSTTCVYNGVEVCVGFTTLRSSRVMVQKTRPPWLDQQAMSTVWSFFSDLDVVNAEDTFEYMPPISNVNVTGEDKGKLLLSSWIIQLIIINRINGNLLYMFVVRLPGQSQRKHNSEGTL